MQALGFAVGATVSANVFSASPALDPPLRTGAGEITLVKDSRPTATIVIRRTALNAEPFRLTRPTPGATAGTPDGKVKLAACDLQKYIEKISGAKLPIVSDASLVRGARILVGSSQATVALRNLKIPCGFSVGGFTPQGVTEEGYVIHAEAGVVVLAGNDAGPYQGTYYAVAEFLRRQGVRWVMPGDFGEVVPQKTTVTVHPGTFADQPSFPLRTWWCDQPLQMWRTESLWKMRNKMQVNQADIIGVPNDGSLRDYMPDKALVKTQPELFARDFDGTPNPYLPNLSNPNAAWAVADKIIEKIRQTAETGMRLHTLGFAPDDGLPMDHTPATMKENQGFTDWGGRQGVFTEWSTSEEWFTFVNRVTQRIDKAYPGFILTTNGYANRSMPPENVPLHSNLGLELAFIWADATKPVTSPRSWQGQVMGAEIKRWCELCNRAWVYEYNYPMLVTTLTPVPQVQNMVINYPLYKKFGLFGFANEAIQPYMAEGIVTRYLRAQLMWNADLHAQAVLADFYASWYGPAAAPAQTFWEAIENRLLDSPLLGHEDRILPFVYTPELLAALEAQIQMAEKAAPDEPYRTRVRIDRLTLEHLQAYMAYNAAAVDANWVDAVNQLEHMVRLRLELNKISPFLSLPPSLKAPERYWAGDRYWGTLSRRDFFVKLRDFTAGRDGTLVAVAPKTARFMLDPAGIGKDLQWFAPDFDRTSWRRIDATQPFYIQGYLASNGVPYMGKMWYVFEVDVPASFHGRYIRLFTPVVTCQAWAWVNGRYAGVRRYLQAYTRPASLDLDVTPLVHTGRKNEIALWVDTAYDPAQASDGVLGRLFLYAPRDPNKTLSA